MENPELNSYEQERTIDLPNLTANETESEILANNTLIEEIVNNTIYRLNNSEELEQVKGLSDIMINILRKDIQSFLIKRKSLSIFIGDTTYDIKDGKISKHKQTPEEKKYRENIKLSEDIGLLNKKIGLYTDVLKSEESKNPKDIILINKTKELIKYNQEKLTKLNYTDYTGEQSSSI